MSEVTVSALFIYPIKSAGPVALRTAAVERRGFRLDRRYMLVDADGVFISQRTHPRLGLAAVQVSEDALLVEAPAMGTLRVPLAGGGHGHGADQSTRQGAGHSAELRAVSIFDDRCEAERVTGDASRYFSDFLGAPCELVRMPDQTRRAVDPAYALSADDVVSFADAYPFLVISTASLDALNARLAEPITMARFRPNIVVTGCPPFAEDAWRDVRIGNVDFCMVKPCARCVITTIDPETAIAGREPLATLAKFRGGKGKNVYFAQNAVARGPHDGARCVSVGDLVT